MPKQIFWTFLKNSKKLFSLSILRFDPKYDNPVEKCSFSHLWFQKVLTTQTQFCNFGYADISTNINIRFYKNDSFIKPSLQHFN